MVNSDAVLEKWALDTPKGVPKNYFCQKGKKLFKVKHCLESVLNPIKKGSSYKIAKPSFFLV